MEPARAARDEHACLRLRPRGGARRARDDDPRDLPLTDVVVYHAAGCHLCERALATLRAARDELGFELTEVDIGGDAELEACYREWLPVVEIDGERAFVYHVPADALRRKVAHKVPRN